MRSALPLSALVLLAISGCGASADAPDAPAERTGDTSSATSTLRYEDILTFWVDAPQDQWLDAVGNVVSQFNQICGDTFCDGDYSDLTSLELTCSVSPVEGKLHACSWTFAGSLQIVDAATGYIHVSKPTFACAFAPTGTAADLRTFFAQPGSLQATLPGGTQSLYDVIGDCFQHPIGATQLDPPGTGAYDDGVDTLGQGWYDLGATLRGAFATLCDAHGLCAYNRPWLQPLTFDCSVATATGALDKCMWTFGEGGATVTPSTGTIHTTQSTTYCMVPVTGTASALVTELTKPGKRDALHRTLPGTTTTIAKVLDTCLQ